MEAHRERNASEEGARGVRDAMIRMANAILLLNYGRGERPTTREGWREAHPRGHPFSEKAAG